MLGGGRAEFPLSVQTSHKLEPTGLSVRLRAHGSGSMFDLFSFRPEPYRSYVDATNMDPIPRSEDVKRGFLLRKGSHFI